MHVGNGRDLTCYVKQARDSINIGEVETTSEVSPLYRNRTGRGHIVIAVGVTEVFHVHRVFRGLLGMTPEPELCGSQTGPFSAGWGIIRQIPLRRPPADAPPGEDHSENLPRMVDAQSRRFWSRGIWSGNALARPVELETVERTDKAPAAHPAAHRRPQVRAQMRTIRFGHADMAFPVGPGDDFLAHPGFFRSDSFAEWMRGSLQNTTPRGMLKSH